MARKGWQQLSAAYRARLEKGGVSKAAYERGESIQSARGHSQTPERPTQANPAIHGKYVATRSQLVTTVVARKQAFFGTSAKWNPTNSRKPFDLNPPPIAWLRKWAKYSYEEWLGEIRENPETIAYLGYH